MKTEDEEDVFLKNVGDKVTLWFELNEDIDALRGDKNFRVSVDKNGKDAEFQTGSPNFKRGALIIRYTDESGDQPYDDIIYTDFLSACSHNMYADTKVQLFEEGDYEVHLDYQLEEVPKVGPFSGVKQYHDYQISFSFKIRNGNAMAFPREIEDDEGTGSELSDGAYTEKGVWLDLAESKFLKIGVTRTILKTTQNGTRTEDDRINSIAKDGSSFKDPGIYTFDVTNLYTGRTTTKTIYVGPDSFLKALSVNGLKIEDLNNMIRDGYEIAEDGTLSSPEEAQAS